jgi:hypothetical protein
MDRARNRLRRLCWPEPVAVSGVPDAVAVAAACLDHVHRAVRVLHQTGRVLAIAWIEAHWLRFGEVDRKEERQPSTVWQDANAYRVDHGWPSRKFDLLNDTHKRMVVEMIHALLRPEGKQ